MSLSLFHVLRGFHLLRAFVGPRCGDTRMDIEEMERVPGLFRGWELPLILLAGADYRLEAAGALDDGAPLLAVYRRRDREQPEVAP